MFQHLGEDVEPVPLMAYIPEEPIGRPRGSLVGLTTALPNLTNPDYDSTPVSSRRINVSLSRIRFICYYFIEGTIRNIYSCVECLCSSF